jgi:hypothetical protein
VSALRISDDSSIDSLELDSHLGALFEEVFAHARTDHERAQCLVVRVQLHVSRGSILPALDLAVKGLALCGETLDLAPTPEAVGAGFAELGAAIAGRSFEVLAELPEAQRPVAERALAGGILHSLAVRARGGAKRKELDALAANAIQMLTARV